VKPPIALGGITLKFSFDSAYIVPSKYTLEIEAFRDFLWK